MMEKPGLYPNGRTLGWIVAGGGASALFFFSSIYVPLVGSLLGILTPLPLMVLSLRGGWAKGMLASCAAALLIGFSLKPLVAVYFFVQFAMLALVSSYLVERRAPFGTMMLLASAAVTAGFFLLIGAQASLAHQGFFEALKKPLQENMRAVLSTYPGLSGTEAKEAAEMFQKMLSWLMVLIPALIMIGSWLILLVNFYLLDRMGLVPGRRILRDYDLNVWKAPDHLIWSVILPGFAVFFMHSVYRIVALNILTVALTVYFFQGLCIINYYFLRKAVPPFVKMMVYFLLFVLQIVAVMVIVLGLLDMWFDFRKLSKTPKDPHSPDETLQE